MPAEGQTRLSPIPIPCDQHQAWCSVGVAPAPVSGEESSGAVLYHSTSGTFVNLAISMCSVTNGVMKICCVPSY